MTSPLRDVDDPAMIANVSEHERDFFNGRRAPSGSSSIVPVAVRAMDLAHFIHAGV